MRPKGRVTPVLLFVCHANVCRSPMAERLARLAFAQRAGLAAAGLHVASAGTHAIAGASLHPPVADVLRTLGADVSGFRSRPVTAALVARSTVVLTATRAQRAAVVRVEPAGVRRVFTLRQFGRLAEAVAVDRLAGVPGPQRLAALVAEMPAARAGTQPVAGSEDDLADPIDGTAGDVWSCAQRIQRSLDPVWALIGVT